MHDYSAKSLRPINDVHISTTVQVVADQLRGNKPLKQTCNTEQESSDRGSNFKELTNFIGQTKSWLITITEWGRIQTNSDKYYFRINLSQFKEFIFHNILERMTIHLFHQQLKQTVCVTEFYEI